MLKQKGQDEELRMMREVSEIVNIHYVRHKERLGLGYSVYCACTFVLERLGRGTELLFPFPDFI
ncbi:MAG: hypothetical protein Q7J27_06920 [Syntrophales bacterium]|nr:hypothetical protein [Syntrophales bacterium]